MMKHLLSIGIGCILAGAGTVASAQDLKMSTTLSEAGQWTLTAAPLTLHFSDINRDADSTDEKHKYVWLVGAEKNGDRQVFCRRSVF